MLYKIVAAAVLLTSADAFRIGEVAKRSIASGIAAATLTLSGPAFAELKQASDAEVYARADAGKLNSARVIERAKAGTLVDGSSATCPELEVLIRVDEKAIKFEKDKLEAIGGGDAAQKKVVADAEKAIEKQVAKLEGLKKTKGCAPELKQASDADVYKRADEGKLNSARVIERAKAGKLVDGSGASCSELKAIISTDKEAIEFEKDKLEAMGGDAAAKKVVADAEKAIEAQTIKLEGLLKTKGCK